MTIMLSLIFSTFFFKEEILLYLWHYPSLSVHGIEGASHEPGTKTVICKFSIHQILHMDLLVVKQEVRGKHFLWPLLYKLVALSTSQIYNPSGKLNISSVYLLLRAETGMRVSA